MEAQIRAAVEHLGEIVEFEERWKPEVVSALTSVILTAYEQGRADERSRTNRYFDHAVEAAHQRDAARDELRRLKRLES